RRQRLLVQRDERLPVVEDVGQVLQRLAGWRRGRALREGARIRLPGLIGVPELPFQLADAQEQIDPLVGLLLVRQLDPLHLDEAGEVIARFVDRLQLLDGRLLQRRLGAREVGLQRGPRASVRRLQRQRLAIRGDRARAVREVLLEDGATPELQLRDRAHVGREIDLRLDRRRQVLPATELLVNPIEGGQRRRLLRILGEDLLIELHRLVGLLDLLLVQVRQLEADGELLTLALGQPQLLVVDGKQIGEASGGDEEPFERLDRLRVLRRQLQDLLIALDRGVGVPQLRLVRRGQRPEQRQERRLIARRARHRRFVSLDQLTPAPPLLRQ